MARLHGGSLREKLTALVLEQGIPERTRFVGYASPEETPIYYATADLLILPSVTSKTGKELWVTKLDYSALSVPLSYQGKNGKQYVAVTASGGGGITDPNPANTEALYVFSLP